MSFNPDSKTCESLHAQGAQQCWAAMGEAKVAVIQSLARIPLCSHILVEYCEQHAFAEGSLNPMTEQPADIDPVCLAGEVCDTHVGSVLQPNAVDLRQASIDRETYQDTARRIGPLRARLNEVMRAGVGTEAGERARRGLVSEFCRFDLTSSIIFTLIRHVSRVAQRMTHPSCDLPKAERVRMDAALKRIGKAVRDRPPERIGLYAAARSPVGQRGSSPALDELEQHVGLRTDRFSDSLGRLASAVERYVSIRSRLVDENFRLVGYIASQFSNTSVDFADRVQEGSIGLLKAIEKFDYRYGYRFSTYASFWIRLSITRALSRQQRVVPLPYAQMSRLFMIARASQAAAQASGKEPSVAALAHHLRMDPERVRHTLAAGQGIISFDQNERDADDMPSLYNRLEQSTFAAPFDTIAERALQAVLSDAIATLDAREARIVGSHFGMMQSNERTLQDLGLEMNLSRERVRQIKVKALERLRKRFGDVLYAFIEPP